MEEIIKIKTTVSPHLHLGMKIACSLIVINKKFWKYTIYKLFPSDTQDCIIRGVMYNLTHLSLTQEGVINV